jgi:hypothetical protein
MDRKNINGRLRNPDSATPSTDSVAAKRIFNSPVLFPHSSTIPFFHYSGWVGRLNLSHSAQKEIPPLFKVTQRAHDERRFVYRVFWWLNSEVHFNDKCCFQFAGRLHVVAE